MVEETASVRQSILLLLSTIPGERVMRPDYGCELPPTDFLAERRTTAGFAIHYTRQALERWEPRIEITYLDASRNPDSPGQLDIELEYRCGACSVRIKLHFQLAFTGDQS